MITKRFIKFLKEQAKEDAEKYATFWETFGLYIKEGVTTDFEYREELGELLRFQSSKSEGDAMVSLRDYVDRMKEGQDKIYYINGPSREALEAGPYVEMFSKKDIEILFTLEPIDDFVLNHLGEFDGKKLVSADRSDLELPEAAEEDNKEEAAEQGQDLGGDEAASLCSWMKEVLGDRVGEIALSHRLVSSPAMIVNADGYLTSSMERVLQASAQEEHLAMSSKKNLEINAASPLIKRLASLRETRQDFARDVVEQIYDNAMIQAGLVVNSQKMVQRNYRILEHLAGEE